MRELHMHRLPRVGVYPLPNDIGELDIFHTTRGEDASMRVVNTMGMTYRHHYCKLTSYMPRLYTDFVRGSYMTGLCNESFKTRLDKQIS
jgi:hypothetical protein